ncbi:monocarboxylate transporter [Fusarium heterosporum]|uniref:Monocarboxylate transporter n=1 Tax=Fusarium heterosporum TaxID=42747 RepID=A0A8H5WXD0_FUSHE|nr:monocarboxylate transporter [Fusarium heterosporum]
MEQETQSTHSDLDYTLYPLTTSSAPGLSGSDLATLRTKNVGTVDPNDLHTDVNFEHSTLSPGIFTDDFSSDHDQTNPISSIAVHLETPVSSGATVPALPKCGKRLSLNSVRVLNKWLASNTHHPYPSVGEVETIERQTGLSRRQILNWFANARRRKRYIQQQTADQSSGSSGASPLDIPPRPATPFIHQSPFERWQNSPPEDEPSSMTAIARAVSGASAGPPRSTQPRKTPSSTAPSVDNSDSSISSLGSTYSHASDVSLESFKQVVKRRRRAGLQTFKLKHTWSRHERTQHLSLEQWECSPSGPTVLNQQSEPVCVYCGRVNPEEFHFEMHNHDLCHNRERGERTFFRKDHLRQHLRLVHGSEFIRWPMEEWKIRHEDVVSRCGFCDLVMTMWSERVDHLAQHFKEGSTMADWKGHWGFDSATFEMVENSMPPYLIDYERNSPLPFTTHQGAPYSSTSAFELLQLELDYFYSNYVDIHHTTPSNEVLHLEACCIIFGAEMCYQDTLPTVSSWLRDLLMGTEVIANKARVAPMKSAARSRFTELRIHSKRDIFEDCKLENALHQYVDMLKLLNLEIADDELQREACSVINHMPNASPVFANLLIALVYGSTHWLGPFRLRAGLPSAEVASYSNLAREDEQLNDANLSQHDEFLDQNAETQIAVVEDIGLLPSSQFGLDPPAFTQGPKVISLNDGNMYRGLTRDLTRYVARTISPLNPTSHVPTDEELQYQARWIMYDCHDVWNQTPADNPDWLDEFKRESGFFQ